MRIDLAFSFLLTLSNLKVKRLFVCHTVGRRQNLNIILFTYIYTFQGGLLRIGQPYNLVVVVPCVRILLATTGYGISCIQIKSRKSNSRG